METGLDQLKLNLPSVVTQIDGAQELQSRLRDFGLVPGTKVICRYRSPGGKVTALAFRGMVLAMRTRDLKKIRVQTR